MGFWEMIYFQVEDVDKKFEKLIKLESRNWVEEIPTFNKPKKKVTKKPTTNSKKPQANSSLKALIAAKRKAAEEAKVASQPISDVVSASTEQNQDPAEEAPKMPAVQEEEPPSKRLTVKEMI